MAILSDQGKFEDVKTLRERVEELEDRVYWLEEALHIHRREEHKQ